MDTLIPWENPEEAAQICAGNWLKFGSFGWGDRPHDADQWYIFYTSNRDTQCAVELSNEKEINEELAQFEETADAVAERHRHFAYGYVDGWAVRVRAAGKLTPAFLALCKLGARLADYALLNEHTHSEIQVEQEGEAFDSWARSDLLNELEKLAPYTAERAELMDSDTVYEALHQAMETTGDYWEHNGNEGATLPRGYESREFLTAFAVELYALRNKRDTDGTCETCGAVTDYDSEMCTCSKCKEAANANTV